MALLLRRLLHALFVSAAIIRFVAALVDSEVEEMFVDDEPDDDDDVDDIAGDADADDDDIGDSAARSPLGLSTLTASGSLGGAPLAVAAAVAAAAATATLLATTAAPRDAKDSDDDGDNDDDDDADDDDASLLAADGCALAGELTGRLVSTSMLRVWWFEVRRVSFLRATCCVTLRLLCFNRGAN